MTSKPSLDLASISDYVFDNSVRDDPLLRALREETAQDDMARMQISAEQGQLMALLVKLTGAKRIIEVGTFTGYSSLCMARALPEDGELICCDLSEQWTNIAKRYWQQAQVAQKIKLVLAPAQQTLQTLIDDQQQNQFDLAFIDADKESYDTYYEQCLQLLRSNGVILLDNMLWSGRVADPEFDDEDTLAIRRLNQKLLEDQRVDVSLLTVADGISLIRKR
ncbi:methyltransferase domain-containing protein [Ketobacter sp. MCCC 1A13808]|uniref:O-methyltransferase n=1 Tax=Ketobacter sp. MCCC 1A13808 TaxID=2602738 RepID=UPI000F218C1C|nr:class I SAM-dependent methyltransferase [Ketobacter sp. MCCC 1A13808]MVF12721.1 methyltransferase domain-containing protein [Ketobacter sp. MCCC 1A13808]RLP53983.1 MAG: methyltransferase domain-containing protein [Ketobacter sp.]